MHTSAAPAFEATIDHDDSLLPNWLYRSESFAEDLPCWNDAPVAPRRPQTPALATWLLAAPLAAAALGVLASTVGALA